MTQEYFAEDERNHVTNTEQCIDDFLTDDDIAVFRSQLNDIPVNLASQSMRREITTNVKLLTIRHQNQFLLSIEETDPIRQLLAISNQKSTTKKRSGSRGISLSTYRVTEEENQGNGLEDRLSPKFEKL